LKYTVWYEKVGIRISNQIISAVPDGWILYGLAAHNNAIYQDSISFRVRDLGKATLDHLEGQT